MLSKKLGEIEAVAFDIDGTLYPSYRLTIRAIFHYIFHSIFFLKYGLVRGEMHGMPPLDNFMEVQAEKMAKRLHCSPEKAAKRLDDIVYIHLKKYFLKLSPFDDVKETFNKFKEAGLKLALLSDFPPEQKGDVWGVLPLCDVVLGTEACGALKPDPHSFLKMAKELNVEPSKILYIGNSKKYDVKGAKNAGMKSGFLLTGWRKIFNKPYKLANICFSNYRQLQEIVLEYNV